MRVWQTGEGWGRVGKAGDVRRRGANGQQSNTNTNKRNWEGELLLRLLRLLFVCRVKKSKKRDLLWFPSPSPSQKITRTLKFFLLLFFFFFVVVVSACKGSILTTHGKS